MVIKAFTFEKYHGKSNIGSTKLRIKNMIPYWPELSLYKYGEFADVLIFQKVYQASDSLRSGSFQFIKNWPTKKILDLCDADWLGYNGATNSILVAETCQIADAIVTSTEELAKFIRQLTDKRVVCIKDRIMVDKLSGIKQHRGALKTVVWFGFAHNAELLKGAIPVLERENIKLITISNDDIFAWRWAKNEEKYKKMITHYKFDWATLYDYLKMADAAILPTGGRPQDRFKSNNRDLIAMSAGLPIIRSADDIDNLKNPEQRSIIGLKNYELVKKEYDIIKSVEEYRELINELRNSKT